jgi:heat shock protein HtpX
MSGVRTVFLLTLLTMVLVVGARLLGFGQTGMIIAFAIGLGLNVINFFFSSKLILAAYGAKVLEPGTPEAAQFAWLIDDVAAMAQKAGLPMPKVAIIPKEAPNAFATGRNPKNAVVAATVGLLRILDRRQVRAVMGHELGHVKNRDMLTMTIVAGAVSAIGFLANIAQFSAMFGGHSRDGENRPNPIVLIAVAILAPLVAMLVQMAISRSREYGADDSGAELSGDPEALASALERLHSAIPHAPPMTASGSTAHLMIANPFSGRSLATLFSTHPDPKIRIARLREMAARGR